MGRLVSADKDTRGNQRSAVGVVAYGTFLHAIDMYPSHMNAWGLPKWLVDGGWVPLSAAIIALAGFLTTFARGRKPYKAIDYAVHFDDGNSRQDAQLTSRALKYPDFGWSAPWTAQLQPDRSISLYRSSLRIMCTGKSDIADEDVPGGIVIRVSPGPRYLYANVASRTVHASAVGLTKPFTNELAVSPRKFRPGDWFDVDLFTDQPVAISHVRAQITGGRRARHPKRVNLHIYDSEQWLPRCGEAIASLAIAILTFINFPSEPDNSTTANLLGWLFFVSFLWFCWAAWRLVAQAALMIHFRHTWLGHYRLQRTLPSA